MLSFAQESDSTKLKPKKNLRFSIVGGPSFTPDAGALVGAGALMTFTPKNDTLAQRSVVPIAAAYFLKGGGILNIRPQIYLKSDRIRIQGRFRVLDVISHYYGVGFETNSERERDEDITQHRLFSYELNPNVIFRWKETDFFWGFSYNFQGDWINEPSVGVASDAYFLDQLGNSGKLRYKQSGFGIRLSYDTRDIPVNAYRGLYFDLRLSEFNRTLGSSVNFGIYEFQYRQYKSLEVLGKRKILAWVANARLTSGDVPFTELSTVGSPFDLRGYFNGHYRDKHTAYTIIEYRNMFNTGRNTRVKRWVSHLGFAAWTGIGTIAADLNTDIDMLPNFGAGLRVELQPRMNARLDVGYDPLNKKTLIYLDITEAF